MQFHQQKVKELAHLIKPVVPVIKSNRSIQLFRNYTTVNQAAKQDLYPLPKIEQLFASLAGERVFSKLGLSRMHMLIYR